MSNFPNDPLLADWTGPYDPPGFGSGTFYPGPGRLAVIPAYREEPLQEPYILWDSRTWIPHQGVFQNLGTAGSLFDLKMLSQGSDPSDSLNFGQVLPYEYVYGFKTLNWDNSFGSTPDPPGGFPETIDDIGGHICNGAFTMMVAFSPTFQPTFDNDPEIDYYQYVEIDFNSNNDIADGGGVSLSQNMIGANDEDLNGDVGQGVFHEWYDSTNYCQWLAQSPDASNPTPIGTNIAGKLVTITVDPWMGYYWVWYDNHLVQFYDMFGDYEPYPDNQMNFIDFPYYCTANDTLVDPQAFHEVFLYFGESRGAFDWNTGAAWRNVVGAAFFRGQPSQADITYWREYFYPEGQQYQGLTGQHDIQRTALANTAPHSETWEVPYFGDDPEQGQYPADHVVMHISCAEGSAGVATTQTLFAIVECEPGDEFTVELGGAGGMAVSSGLGGWPDGGDGGLSVTTATRGGGGGGSTRIYLNGNLIIHAPGSGGGPTLSTGGNNLLATDQRGGRVSIPGDEGPEGTIQTGLGYTNEAFRGKGGTQSGPGAGGSGGGLSGSGNDGGDGGTSSGTGRTGGGGGGGGYFGGGGGGFTAPNLPFGGGSGSWWWDSGVVTMENQIPVPGPQSQSGQIKTQGLPARVIIYYPAA